MCGIAVSDIRFLFPFVTSKVFLVIFTFLRVVIFFYYLMYIPIAVAIYFYL